jgi:hypothetical protein
MAGADADSGAESWTVLGRDHALVEPASRSLAYLTPIALRADLRQGPAARSPRPSRMTPSAGSSCELAQSPFARELTSSC